MIGASGKASVDRTPRALLDATSATNGASTRTRSRRAVFKGAPPRRVRVAGGREIVDEPSSSPQVNSHARPHSKGQVQVVMGSVQWATGADLAPDAMYDAIKTHGRWVVE